MAAIRDIKPEKIVFTDDTEHATLVLIDFTQAVRLPATAFLTDNVGSVIT